MKIAQHIAFHYVEARIKYLKQVLEASSQYDDDVDVFIHTNNVMNVIKNLDSYPNLNIEIIKYKESYNHPHYLTWQPRLLMKEQINLDYYDTYMYVEDDILVTNNVIQYWKKYFHSFMTQKINLGFIRIEKDTQGDYCWTDTSVGSLCDLKIESDMLSVGRNQYCAFWIHDKKLTKKMLEVVSEQHWDKHSIREAAARGANALFPQEIAEKIFNKTCIPLENGNIPESCKVYHLPNNFADHPVFLAIKVNDILKRAISNTTPTLH